MADLAWRGVKDDAAIAMRRSAGSAAEYAARALDSDAVAVGRINDRLTGLSATRSARMKAL